MSDYYTTVAIYQGFPYGVLAIILAALTGFILILAATEPKPRWSDIFLTISIHLASPTLAAIIYFAGGAAGTPLEQIQASCVAFFEGYLLADAVILGILATYLIHKASKTPDRGKGYKRKRGYYDCKKDPDIYKLW